MTIRPYLESNFQEAINEGLKEVMKQRPDDPIQFLGNFLLVKSKAK